MGKMTKKTKKIVKKSQDKTALELAIQVSDRIELESIRLMSSNCQQLHLAGPGKKSFDIKRTTDSSMDLDTNRVFVFTNFELETFETGITEKTPLATIESTFLLIYKADSLAGITNKVVEHFANTNGIYNAWPYWREFVQNTVDRMSLPSLTIPVFRIFAPPKPKKIKKKVVSKKTAKKARRAT